MSNHVPLDNITHKDLRVISGYSDALGDGVSMVVVVPPEFRQLIAHYPILFNKDANTGEFATMALLGFSEGENLFLGQAGWDADYVPLGIQRQPFLIGYQPGSEPGQQDPVVHIDTDNAHVSTTEGEAVFLEHGGSTPYLERATSVLFELLNGMPAMKAFAARMAELDLIESVRLQVTLDDGREHAMEGLYTIREEALAALPGSVLEQLSQSGQLMLAQLMAASLSRIGALVSRKNQQNL